MRISDWSSDVCSSDLLTVDHQQAVVVAGLEGFDDHRARVLARGVGGLADLVVAADVDGDAAAVVAVVGLEHHRAAELARGLERIRLAGDQHLPRHRQAERGEDLVGLSLVAGQLDGDVRRAAGDRGLDALLVLAVAELHQRLLRSEEHTSELQSLMRISYAVFCLKKKKTQIQLMTTL